MVSIRDLVFSPEYPYRYQYKNEIIFSKNPILIPSLIERAEMKKFLKNYKRKDYNILNKIERR